MKIRGYVAGYFLLMGFAAAGCLFLCYAAAGFGFLPEGLAASGGVLGFLSMAYGIWLSLEAGMNRENVRNMGDMKVVTSCRIRQEGDKAVPCRLVFCKDGLVMEPYGKKCICVPWADVRGYEGLPFEIRFRYDFSDYRLLFSDKLETGELEKLFEMNIPEKTGRKRGIVYESKNGAAAVL